MIAFRPTRYSILLGLVILWFALAGCDRLPASVPLLPSAPTPARQITYDGAITLTVKVGETSPGTGIAYLGKAPDGRAVMTIDGLQALKSTADSVKWTGAVVLFSLIDLNLRVIVYDDAGMTLAGTIHIVVQDPNPTPADPSSNQIASFLIPVTYTISRGQSIPGTTVIYDGTKPSGAEFTNLDQFPFRDRFDSVVWQGRLRDRISVRQDLRVIDFNDDRVILGGTVRVIFES